MLSYVRKIRSPVSDKDVVAETILHEHRYNLNRCVCFQNYQLQFFLNKFLSIKTSTKWQSPLITFMSKVAGTRNECTETFVINLW